MTASPVLLETTASAPARRAGPLAWLLGGAAALVATLVAAVVAVLAAAALAVVAVLAFVVALLALAAWRVRRRRGAEGGPQVISARWTGYGWDAR